MRQTGVAGNRGALSTRQRQGGCPFALTSALTGPDAAVDWEVSMEVKKTTAILALAALALAACSTEGKEPIPPSAYGPITTFPIVGQTKVPAGTTPTGATGYATANSARSNGTIVDGTAAQCGAENAGGGYDIACGQAAGLPGTATPYR